jgi:hydrogenase maturation protease
MKTLLYGIGNVSRQDDAVGVLCAGRLEEWCRDGGPAGVTVESGYQLQIEDAEAIAGYDRVIFLDASVASGDDVRLEPVAPRFDATHTTHAVSPECILALCRELYGRTPETYALHIPVREFELGVPMTPDAGRQLERAVALVRTFLAGPAPDLSSRRTP